MNGQLREVVRLLDRPGLAQLWNRNKEKFVPAFVEAVERDRREPVAPHAIASDHQQPASN